LDVKKSLAGHVFLGDFTNGLYMGYAMHAIKDFRTSNNQITGFTPRIQPYHRDIDASKANTLGVRVPLRFGGRFCIDPGSPDNGNWGGLNGADPATVGFVNAGWYPSGCILYSWGGNDHAYSDPDWATSFGPTLNDGDDLTQVLNGGPALPPVAAAPGNNNATWPFDSWSLDEVDDALVKQRVQTTYFNGGFSGATFTMLSVAFPTKFLHYFYDAFAGLVDPDTLAPLGDVNDGLFGSRRFGWPVGFQTAQARTIRGQMDVEKYIGMVNARTSVWDMAERRPTDFSPYTWLRLPYEVNFLPIGDLSIPALDPFCFLVVPQPDSPYNLVINAQGYNAGQLFIEGFSLTGGIQAADPRTTEYNSPPVVGGYGRRVLPLLGLLEAPPYNDIYIVPALVHTMDFEFTNFSHARSFDANFDNQVVSSPWDYPMF
jgi:hypothetical protein